MADYISKYETGAAVDAALDLAMSALQPESGKGLSTNDFTNEYKDKVDSNDAEISSARGSYATVNERLSGIESEQESQGTALDEDRAALVEIVNGGAKNIINNAATTRTESGVTFTVNADGTVELSGTAAATIWFPIMTNFSISAGTYTINNGLTDDTARVIISPTNSLSSRIFDSNESGYVTRAIDAISGVNAYLRIASGRTTDGVVVKPMLCTKAAWDISHQYVPHRPSYDELIARIEALEAGT